MRVLAHITTFNESEFIDQALDALQRQTRRPDAILIVDNASTDGSLDRTFPENVTVIRNSADLGMSGAVEVGFAHAIEHEFDWTWVFDVDSVPEPDALEKLIAFFERLPPSQQEQVSFLACRLDTSGGKVEHRPILLTKSGIEYAPLDADAAYCCCDCFIWSGSLFRMPAVIKIGLPSGDYCADFSELEYGYRAQKSGLTGYIVSNCLLHHDVGRPARSHGPNLALRAFLLPASRNCRRIAAIITSAICSIFGCISADPTGHAGSSAVSFMPSSFPGPLRSGLSATADT